MHNVALFPDSDPNIFNFPEWLPIVQNQESRELWVSFWWTDSKQLKRYMKSHVVKKLVFYDIFHAHPGYGSDHCVDLVKQCQQSIPTVLLTANKTPVPGIRNVLHFDFYWNRTKSAYLDKRSQWKQLSTMESYNQWPMELSRRPGAMLSLYGKNNWDIKKLLYDRVKHLSGYHSGQDNNTVLPDETGVTDFEKLKAAPPARKYFDNTYISAQIESLCTGPTVLYSEKTYDHLIQGRFVMNFGPRYFYHTLVTDGWKLPVGVDYSWDAMEDDWDNNNLETNSRFHAYIKCLVELSSDLDRLHNLFISNLDVFAHNREQLRQKPYDIISLEQLAHKYH